MGEHYDCEFVETPPKEFECTICLNILKEPHLNNCCGQHFCQQCIQKIIDDQKPCPLCNKADFIVILDKKTECKILDLQVKCWRHKSGCEWEGELRSLEQHCDACTYTEVDCPNSCGEMVQRRFLSSHLEEECSRRHFNCAYCGHKSTHEDVTTVHWPVCDRYPVACPNNCGKEDIPRCEVEEHKAKECPLQRVNCKYKYAGCEAVLLRKELDTHMEKETKEHLNLVERYAELLKNQNKGLQSLSDTWVTLVGNSSRELCEAKQLLRYNCVYTETLWCGRSKGCIFYPFYGPGYRIQMWYESSSTSGHMAITLGVYGARLFGDCDLTWPLKAIVTIELVDPTGRLEPISQSKRCVWYEPRYSVTSTVSFDPFVSWAQGDLYAQGREQKWTFNVYICQPGKHPDAK